MGGEPIESVKSGVQMMLSALKQDPYALETAFLSIITFDSDARQILPLTELPSIQMPELTIGGGTSLGLALKATAEAIENDVTRNTADSKGDWKPMVFLMTDGAPTDDWEKYLDVFARQNKGVVVCCAAGPHAETGVLQKISEVVVKLDTADEASIKAFFTWVSQSMAVTSQKVDLEKKEVSSVSDLPPPPEEIVLVK